jgi:hypothetical protein
MANQMLTRFLEVLIAVFTLLIAVRMFRSGLHRPYACLFAYLICLAPFNLCPALMNLASRPYFWFWVSTEPIGWILEILVVRELCGLVLEQYTGLRSVGRWAIYGGIAISTAISLASLIPRIPEALARRSRVLYYYYMGGERGIHLALGVFLLLMILLSRRLPVPLKRNVVVNAALFTALFFGTTLTALLRTVFDMKIAGALDLGLTVLCAASLVVWLFLLTPAGEMDRVELAHFRREDEVRVLNRLEQLNQWVLQLSRA